MVASSSRAFSPPHSTTSSAQGSPPVQVKKVVLEGRSKHDGASLRMYLKLSVALDNVLPGASIPLFSEDNIRITHSKAHPLDDRSVPYYFSSTEQPLLQKTAIALQLGPKSSRSYHTLFPHTSPPLDPTPTSASRRSRETTVVAPSSSTPHNDERYTGYILVSGYNVALVLPKEFPPKPPLVGAGPESDGDDGFVKDTPSSWSTRSARRSSAMFHKHYLHMMAGLEIFVPYVLTPPKGPFLISIPVPRCLDNHLKLRISTPPIGGSAPPSIPRGSFNSASSEDDSPGWDFLTDPPVSRRADKSLRRASYNQAADDEHSDTPNTHSNPGTELIQGAYQSTDVLHVRWAPPLGKRSGVPKTEDGMRRVGIERTVGKMKCEVLGRDTHGVRLGINYDGTCTGLWHPGVATILGMDMALDVKGRRVSWAEDSPAGWAVSGKDAFSGLYSEASPLGTLSHKSSFDSTSSSTFLPTLANRSLVTPARGSASLLRAPLPNQNTPDYSFENSPNATPPALGSSSTYFPSTTPGPETRMSRSDVSPGKPIALKLNLLKLLPPAVNEFNFSVRGTIHIDTEDEDFVPLPTFRVLGSDKEKVETFISSLTGDAIVQIGAQFPNTPRRTLRTGDEVRCEEGVGLVLRSWESPAAPASSPSTSRGTAKDKVTSHNPAQTPSRRGDIIPNGDTAPRSTLSTQAPRLPCVRTTITPLLDSPQHTHSVRVNIPLYSLEADTIEFGLALPQRPKTPAGASGIRIDLLYASYAGRQVPAEVLPRGVSEPTSPASDMSEESRIVGEIQFLVIVHLEDVEADAGAVEIVYLVGGEDGARQNVANKNKGKGKETVGIDALLPCFQLPVAQYEVEVDCPFSFIPHIKSSTLPNHHITSTNAHKLAHFRLPPGFFPTLSLLLIPSSESISESSKTSGRRRLSGAVLSTITQLSLLALLYLVVSMGTDVRQIRETIHAAAGAIINGIPYPDTYWGYGADPAGNHRGWTQDTLAPAASTEIHTPPSATSQSTTSWQKDTLYLVTPTINLAEATHRPEKRQPRTGARSSHARALIPLPAVPFLTSKLPFSPETKEFITKGLMRVWYLLRKAWNFPVDPE